MSLLPVFIVPQTSLTTSQFTDQTGLYNPSSNPGGWGGGVNPDYASVTAAVLSAYVPSTSTFLPTSAVFSIDLFSDFGYPLSGLSFSLDSTDFGLSAGVSIPIGEYDWTLSITYDFGGEGTASATYNVIYFAKTTCCLDKAWAALGSCGCTDKKTQEKKLNILLGFAELNQIPSAITCNNFTAGINALTIANDTCNNSGCKPCRDC